MVDCLARAFLFAATLLHRKDCAWSIAMELFALTLFVRIDACLHCLALNIAYALMIALSLLALFIAYRMHTIQCWHGNASHAHSNAHTGIYTLYTVLYVQSCTLRLMWSEFMPNPTNRDIMTKLDNLSSVTIRTLQQHTELLQQHTTAISDLTDIVGKLAITVQSIETRLSNLESLTARLTHKVDNLDADVKFLKSDMRDVKSTLGYLYNSHLRHVSDGSRHND